MRTGLLVSASLAAVLSGCTASRTPSGPSDTPPPAPLPFEVSGIASERADGITRPLPGRVIQLWISPGSRNEWSQSAFTDRNGRYATRVPGQARVFAFTYDAPDMEQPCLSSANHQRQHIA